MSSTSDQQPTAVLWLTAVLYFHQDYEAARTAIISGTFQVNGQVVVNPLMQVRSGDILFHPPISRPVDLYALRQANALRRQAEALWGGPEATIRRFGSADVPSGPPN